MFIHSKAFKKKAERHKVTSDNSKLKSTIEEKLRMAKIGVYPYTRSKFTSPSTNIKRQIKQIRFIPSRENLSINPIYNLNTLQAQRSVSSSLHASTKSYNANSRISTRPQLKLISGRIKLNNSIFKDQANYTETYESSLSAIGEKSSKLAEKQKRAVN